MNATRNLLFTATAAFTGGFVSGLLYASQQGVKLRGALAQKAEGPTRWVEHRLHEVDRQLSQLEAQIAATSAEFGQRLRETTQQTLGQYVPAVEDHPDDWSLDDREVTRYLRHMPRS